jgi:hypothetical protein
VGNFTAGRARVCLALLAAVVLGGGCNAFRRVAPDEAPEVNPPRVVSVTVQYRQPNGCLNVETTCDEPVVFFGSWMHPGQEFQLTPDPAGNFIWRGTARNVPVNYPPRDQPYLVRIFDPFLREGPGGGVTAQRLWVGGELLDKFDRPGGEDESALVYIDENGVGHDPFF